MKEEPPRLDEMPDVLTIPEVAALFRMSRSTAYEHASRNALPIPVIRCGRHMYVSKTSLLQLLGRTAARDGQPAESDTRDQRKGDHEN